MKFFNSIKISSKVFETHRSRTMLSVLGIIIGITSVIMIINAGQGLKKFIMDQVEVFGTDYIEVEVKVPSTKQTSTDNASGMAQGVSITTLKHEEALEIKEHPNISQVYSGVLGQQLVSYQNENQVGLLWGVSSGFFEIDKTEIEQGRSFSEDEDDSLSQVVVLGYKIKADLFGEENALGKKIKIGNSKFKVIGVREEIGGGSFIDMDEMILIPLKTLQKKVMGIDHVSFIFASVINTKIADQTAADITEIMRQAHNITDPNKDDFAVVTSEQAMEMLGTILNGITLFLVAIAAISLIVGGVGIMNIMYVSVLERTYEIGLRKAVGATRIDILSQFLGEALLITFAGGLIGVVLGIGLSWLSSILAQSQGIMFQFVVSVPGIVTACLFMVLVGLLFGIYPAKKAAGLDPVEALRYE